jgi:phosphoribosylanthranilate isomerase
MARVRIKICGIRSLEEAGVALGLGADAIGFNFWKGSRRYIDPDAARHIIARQNQFFGAYVGVFVNEEEAVIRRVASDLGLAAVQLHGDEPHEFCEHLSPLRVIKALRVTNGFDPKSVSSYRASAVLLDSQVGSMYGGTGYRFDWQVAIEAKQYAPIILAGGINSDNVSQAVRAVGPLAIDVCSGVEAEPGRKDFGKMREFMTAFDRANSDLSA